MKLSRYAPRRRPRAAVVLALVAAAIHTPVLGHDPDPALSGGTFGQSQALELRWRSGFEPPSAIRTAVLEAAGDSNAKRASRAETSVYHSPPPNPIGYGSGTCGLNGLACFTRTVPTGFTMWF